MKEKKKILLASIGILMLVLVTVGVTFAVFTYTKLGTTENTVTTGTLKFLYTENTGVGNGINIENAFPVTDAVGKSYDTDKYVFDFSVEATNSGSEEIPYEVTLRKKSTSTLSNNNVKVYLTDMTGDADIEILAPTLYSDLIQTTIDVGEEVEKTLYNGTVLGGELTYLKDFRLRMWIDNNSDQDDINGKTFIALVNVYSNVPLVSEEEINSRNNTEISVLNVNGIASDKVTGEDYSYEVTVPEGTTEVTFNVETINDNATVEIEKIDSLSYNFNIKRLSTSKTFQLSEGANYFKIAVTSENKQSTDFYYLLVKVGGLSGFAKKIYDANPIIDAEPTLTTSSNNTTDASGLYKSTDTNDGSPTYYFRGAVENNYVDFAGFTWRIVRINEDGTIRLIMENGINDNKTYQFSGQYNGYSHMYYTNSGVNTNGALLNLSAWYTEKMANNESYLSKMATGAYYCQQVKVKKTSLSFTAGNATIEAYSSYTPSFKCEADGNNMGIVNSNIGLITYDENLYAGGYYNLENKDYYLYNGLGYWTMSPGGTAKSDKYYAYAWFVGSSGQLDSTDVYAKNTIRPVINLKSNVTVTGTGASDNHYVVQP